MHFEQLQPLTNQNGYPEIQGCEPVEVLACDQQGRQGGKLTFFHGRVQGMNGQPVKCSFATNGMPVSAGMLNVKCSVKQGQYGREYTFWPEKNQSAPQATSNRPAPSAPTQSGYNSEQDKQSSIQRQVAFKAAVELAIAGKIELTQIGSFTQAFADLLDGKPLDVVSVIGGVDSNDIPF